MKCTSTLILAEEKNNLIKKENDTSNHTVHRDFTPETLNQENQNSFENYYLLLTYSIRIKGYISNLGPHLRHNRRHTLLYRQEKPCSQFSLHMHDKQPTIYRCNNIFFISLYGLTQNLFIEFTTRKTLNIGTQKNLQIHAYH
jgi:hypothetical protein